MTDSSPDALRVWFRMMRLETRMRSVVAERLRAFDLSVPQCDVLTTLSEQEGISQQDLAERLYVTKGNISGLIDRLAAAGLVERRALPGDRRSHALHLTEAGRAAAAHGIATQVGFVEETIGRMAPQDLADLERCLRKARDLTRAAQAHTQGARAKTASPGGSSRAASPVSPSPSASPTGAAQTAPPTAGAASTARKRSTKAGSAETSSTR
jgi:DNA-binding MarR family transcriptional regulator